MDSIHVRAPLPMPVGQHQHPQLPLVRPQGMSSADHPAPIAGKMLTGDNDD